MPRPNGLLLLGKMLGGDVSRQIVSAGMFFASAKRAAGGTLQKVGAPIRKD
jgi:hypothetical protein